jgi:hypothetical protein
MARETGIVDDRTEWAEKRCARHVIRCPECKCQIKVTGFGIDAVDQAAEAVLAAHRC